MAAAVIKTANKQYKLTDKQRDRVKKYYAQVLCDASKCEHTVFGIELSPRPDANAYIRTILKRIFATFNAFSLQDEPILLSYFNFRFVQFTKVAI